MNLFFFFFVLNLLNHGYYLFLLHCSAGRFIKAEQMKGSLQGPLASLSQQQEREQQIKGSLVFI